MSIFHKKDSSDKSSNSILLYLVGAILLSTLGLQIYERTKPATASIPMLSQAPGMIELTKIEDLRGRTQTNVTLPEKLFGASLFVIGVYPNPLNTWPANTVSIIFTKNNARFVVMDVLPNTKLDTYSLPYTGYPQETVIIHPETPGKYIRLRSGFDCTHPKSKEVPSMCLITNILLFEHNGSLLQLSADGNHISQGELIEMARSIK